MSQKSNVSKSQAKLTSLVPLKSVVSPRPS